MRLYLHPRRARPVAAACAALLAAACSGPAVHPAAAKPRPPGRPSAPVSIPPAARASSSPSAPASPPAAAPGPAGTPGVPEAAACTTSSLTVTVGQESGAAGSIYYPLEFRNLSGHSCTLFGYPGASFVTGIGGGQVGGAAIRNPTFAAQVVTLVPGASAQASLQVAVAQNYPASLCLPVTAHWLRVYPPNQFVPLYVGFTAVTCTGKIPGGTTLGIYVIRPGTTGT